MTKKKLNVVEASMKHRQVTVVITLILMVIGVISMLTMPRSEDPKITVRQALVIALYPGADELQMEKQVTDKIEQYLFSFEEVRKEKTKSETKEGLVIVTCELQESTDETDKVWNTIQHGLTTNLKQELPQGVIGPIVNSDFGDVVAQMITVSAPGRSFAELESYLDVLEDGIKTIKSTSKINRYGGQQQQIYVTVENEKLNAYGFDISNIAQVLQMQNEVNYSGEITFAASNIPIVTESQYQTEAEVGNQIIYSNPDGTVVRLKDVAKIERRYEEKSSYIKVGDDEVMMLTVEMQPGKNIVQFGKELDGKIAEIKQTLPEDVNVNIIVDQPKVVQHSIAHFMLEFGIAISAVIIVVILFLPFRVAAISAITCPISIVIAFGVLNIMGVEIHQVSLAAMIIVLGMVVDDAIVVVDNYIEKLDEGLDPWRAGWESATQLMVPVFTATIAIIFSFLPLALFLDGISGEFIASLPIAVAIALSVSFMVAIFITPFMCFLFIKKGLKHKVSVRPPKLSFLDRLQEAFNKAVEFCFRYPKWTVSAGGLSIALAIFIASQLDQELFPNAERDQFNLEVWLPNGTELSRTEEVVRQIEGEIADDERIVDIASFIGTSSPRFHVNYAPETARENYAQIFINTVSNEATEEMAKEYIRRFDDYLPDGYIRVRQLALKESPAPIEVRIIGEDLKDQKRVARQVMDILETTEGTNWVRTNYEDEYFGLTIRLKDDVANRLGVTNTQVTQLLGAGLSGYKVSTIWEGDKSVEILLRLDTKDREDFEDLLNLYVSTNYETKVPLREVAELLPVWHTGVIAHRNGLRTITVRSEAQMGRKASQIISDIQPQIAALQLPDGIRIAYGGEFESTTETQPGMARSLGVSLMLIFLTLLFQFKSFPKVLIVLATFPLSLLGAMLGLLITGNPFGFTAFMGIISLIGIVVRNGIILVDYADELVTLHSYSIKAAAIGAAKRRMRPILLTSCAAAVGVFPMILGNSPLWAPLGSVLAVGLLVSMVMTLFIVPILYYKFVKPAPKPDHEVNEQVQQIIYKPIPA